MTEQLDYTDRTKTISKCSKFRHTLLAYHMMGFIVFCLSLHMSIERIRNFRRSFFSNYSLQMLEILAHSFFQHATWWESFLDYSHDNLLFILVFVLRVYFKHESSIFSLSVGITSEHWLTDIFFRYETPSPTPFTVALARSLRLKILIFTFVKLQSNLKYDPRKHISKSRGKK